MRKLIPIFWPSLLYRVSLGFLVSIIGRLIKIVFGLFLIGAGIAVCLSVFGAPIGIALILFGMLLITRGFAFGSNHDASK